MQSVAEIRYKHTHKHKPYQMCCGLSLHKLLSISVGQKRDGNQDGYIEQRPSNDDGES